MIDPPWYHLDSLALPLLPSIVIGVLVVAAIVAAILASTRLYTTARYRFDLWTVSNVAHSPPRLPYTIPFLGQALDFLAPKPGQFYQSVFSKYADLRQAGTCTLRLADQKTHLLYTPTAVQHLFRAPLSRQKFNIMLLTKAFNMSDEQAGRFYGKGGTPEEETEAIQAQERMNHEYLLRPERVNELITHFLKVLRDGLFQDGEQETEISLFRWVRKHMFKASTEALMGTGMLESYPELEEDFFEFDRGFLTMFFGVPRIFTRRIYNLRDKILDQLEEWQEQMQKDSNGQPTDPDGQVAWEPTFGSRINRARQIFYESRSLTLRSRGALDLGMVFGASSNAIPGTGWMLMHLLDPKSDKTVLLRIMDELRTAQKPDGTVDVATLTTLPLLTSTFHETLRLYVDALVSREVTKDQILPLEEGKNPRKVFLEKGSTVIAPSWLGHRDASAWSDPPYDVFYPERFLKQDPETGKTIFTTAGSNGKLFPFGGGKTICPGRVFAKQEVLASVAYVLLNFDLEFVEYVDEKGKRVNKFPGLREGFTGSGIIMMDGDLKVKMKRRSRS